MREDGLVEQLIESYLVRSWVDFAVYMEYFAFIFLFTVVHIFDRMYGRLKSGKDKSWCIEASVGRRLHKS